MRSTIDIALIGNPNVGKSTLFKRLTGENVHIGNWPGVTVDLKEGFFSHMGADFRVIDLPGTYSLRPYSREEKVSLNFLLKNKPDLVLCIIDASSMESTLYIVLQILEMGFPCVVALNKADLVKKRNIHLDTWLMARKLGCPVFPIVALDGAGVLDIKDAIAHEIHHHIRSDVFHPLFHDRFMHDPEAKGENRYHKHIKSDYHRKRKGFQRDIFIKFDKEIEGLISDLEKILVRFDCVSFPNKRWFSLALLEGSLEVLKSRLNKKCEQEIRDFISRINTERIELKIATRRHEFIHELLPDTKSDELTTKSDKIDRYLTNRFLGPLVFIIAIFAMFNITFGLGDPIASLVENIIGKISNYISGFLSGWLESLIVDGVIEGVGAVIVFFPYIFILYFVISLLEESGYMARGAYLLDGFMARFSLPGRSFIPIIMGFGCSVPAILSTRTIPSRNDRIATILVIPFASCGARMPVYVLLAGVFFSRYAGLVIFSLYILGIAVLLISAWIFKNTFLKSEPTPFIMEMPHYKFPSLWDTLKGAFRNTGQFLKKAGTVILIAMILIWGISHFGYDGYIDKIQKDVDGHLSTSSGQIKGEGVFKSKGEEITFTGTIKEDLTYESTENITSGDYYELKLDLEEGEEFKGDGTVNGPVEFYGSGMYSGSDFIIEDSIASDIGKTLEPVFRPLGFDWKIVVSLIFGMVAKEIVIGTLGVLFGSVDDESALSDSIDNSESFSPLVSLEVMVFVLLYIPCIPTLITQKKELGSWKWVGFSLLYTTFVAYVVSLTIRIIGLGMGYS